MGAFAEQSLPTKVRTLTVMIQEQRDVQLLRECIVNTLETFLEQHPERGSALLEVARKTPSLRALLCEGGQVRDQLLKLVAEANGAGLEAFVHDLEAALDECGF